MHIFKSLFSRIRPKKERELLLALVRFKIAYKVNWAVAKEALFSLVQILEKLFEFKKEYDVEIENAAERIRKEADPNKQFEMTQAEAEQIVKYMGSKKEKRSKK